MRKIISIVLGLLLGPLSTIFYGFKIFLLFAGIVIALAIVNTFMHFSIYKPLLYLPVLFFAIHNYILEKMFSKNGIKNKNERKEIAEAYYGGVAVQYTQLIITLTYITGVGKIFQSGHYIKAIIWAVIGLPISFYVVQLLMGFLLLPIFALLSIKKETTI